MRAVLVVPVLIALVVLAGCAGPDTGSPDGPTAPAAPSDADRGPTEGTTGAGAAPKERPPSTAQTAPRLVLEAPTATTKEASILLRGSVDRPALVSIASQEGPDLPEPFEADGPWSVRLALPHGTTAYTVRADDGAAASEATFTAVRLAKATVQVTYRGDLGLQDRDDTFWFDVDALASRDSGHYDGCSQQHPGHANVHDAMMEWTAGTGREVRYGACGDFGVSVEAIEGHESPGFWCYAVNGEPAEFGITLQPFRPDDVVAWDDCALVLG